MKRRSPKDYLSYFAPAFVLTLAGFVIAYQFVDPAPPRRITIATGQPSGAYYEMGQKYSRILARDGVTLEVKSTSGSKENLNLLAEEGSGVDIIFMQGGVGHTGHSGDLVSLGSIYYEPLWVFYRADQAIKCLKDFRGKRVSVGIEGSGTKVLAQQLLFLNNVTSKNSLFLSLKDVDAVEKLLVGEIDAAFFVVAYRGHAGRKLFDSPDIRLHDFRRGAAYAAHYHFLSLLTLPEGAIDFVKNIPSEDMTLLAPTAQLVARRNLHPALIDLLLMAAREVGSPSGFFERRGDFPSPKFTDFPLSSEAERFYASGPPFLRRYLPFWLANFLIRMKVMLLPLVALLFPLFKVLPPFYKWRVRSRIFRWYDQLMEIDYQMLHGDTGKQKNEFLSRLDTIEQNVSQVSVPRGYSRELYDVRVHIEMLREKLIDAGADVCRLNTDSNPISRRGAASGQAGPNSSPKTSA